MTPPTFGKFEILGELGQGAMGRVYRARDPVLDRLVALKTVSPGLLAKKDALARFEREARAAARLQHPNIVTVYEIGEVQGTRYIAMELVEGSELGEALSAASPLTLEQKVRLLADVCRGLDFAHKMGVIHRDVKPANVRLTRDGIPKILDFGIARVGESDITSAGIVLGTPSYVSPELLIGHGVDHFADMWAVGVILYEMLAGRRPFEAPTVTALVHKIVHEPLPPLDAAALGVPPPLAAVALKALDKDPARRFSDLAAFARAVLAAVGVGPALDLPLDPHLRKRAYEANFAEARRKLSEDDLVGALEVARRARALAPAQSGIGDLVRVIEARLTATSTAPEFRPSVEAAGSARPPATGADAQPAPSARVAGPVDTATLRTRGADAFRERGAFGELLTTNDAALSPAADLLALAGADGALRLWDLRTRTRTQLLRTELHRRSGHDAAALALAFSPDGSLLASAHVDGVVHLWDLARGEEVPARLRHDDSVGALAFSPDGSTLAAGSLDASLRLWDVGAALAGEARRELLRQPSPVTALTWAAGGEWLLTGHASRVLRLTDPLRGKLLATFRGPEALVNLLVLSPDCRHVAVGSHDRCLRIFDLATRQATLTFGPLRRPVSGCCFLASGEFLATVSQESSVQLWDLESRSPATALWGPAGEDFVAIALFGDANELVAAVSDGRLRVWGAA